MTTQEEKDTRTLAELKSRAGHALSHARLIRFATAAASPTAAFDMAEDWEKGLRQSTRFLACIRRDYEEDFLDVVLKALNRMEDSELHFIIEAEDGFQYQVVSQAIQLLAARGQNVNLTLQTERGISVFLNIEDEAAQVVLVTNFLATTSNAERARFVEELFEQSDDPSEDRMMTWVVPVFGRMLADNPSNVDLAFIVDHIPSWEYACDDATSPSIQVPTWPYEAARLLLERGPTVEQLMTVATSQLRGLADILMVVVHDYPLQAWEELRRREANAELRLNKDRLKRIAEVNEEDNVGLAAARELKVLERREQRTTERRRR